ncbi:unnamed protein product [Paramecium octaurelia]|uniref:Uncharacterized protein n=1 Tax=Paramecium octaurelia TaxID=43137 RepID=A0A8S1S581_PAROT|nr:unnamed protein product [Paramecium octaurelia]
MFFELDDIRRRHSLYFDCYNAGVWTNAPENSWRWNYTRGAISGLLGSVVGEAWHNFYENWKLLLRSYEQPNTVNELYKFSKATINLENFKRSMGTRMQFAFASGGIDWALRLAAFRAVNHGWQRTWGTFEYGFLRKVPGTMFISLLTAPIGIPFEVARMAYYADKTFPKELQKGYTSFFNALWRIPFEEGPYYFFKNSFPLFARNFFQTLTLLYSFDWMKDKLSVFTRVAEIPYFPVKVLNCFLSTYLAILTSYSLSQVTREMVELWPKPNGVCPYDGNYRKAATHIWYARNLNNYFPGMLRNYASRQFLPMFVTLWWADSFGLFTYWKIDMFSGAGSNTWEDSFC